MHNSITPLFKLMQEGGEHLGRLGFGIVKENDAAPHLLNSGQDQVKFAVGSHGHPVAGPHIGTEHHKPTLVHAIEQGRVRGETRKAEKWRCRLGPPNAEKRKLIRRDTAINVAFGARERHMIEQRV